MVSNGHGVGVRHALGWLPADVAIKNTAKRTNRVPHFDPFNIAPIDLPELAGSDFGTGCWIARDCGIGLNRYGFYPCAAAGGIDRITGQGLAAMDIPKSVARLKQVMKSTCCRCGHFLGRRFRRKEERPVLRGVPVSPTWERLYARYLADKPLLKVYGS